MIKAADRVWCTTTQEELIVAALDRETNELGTLDGRWRPAAACVVQRESTQAETLATLMRAARDAGRVGVMARRELARLWNDGKL